MSREVRPYRRMAPVPRPQAMGSGGDHDAGREWPYLDRLLRGVRRDADRDHLARPQRRSPEWRSRDQLAVWIRINHVYGLAVRADRQPRRVLPGGDRWLGPAIGELDRGDAPGR